RVRCPPRPPRTRPVSRFLLRADAAPSVRLRRLDRGRGRVVVLRARPVGAPRRGGRDRPLPPRPGAPPESPARVRRARALRALGARPRLLPDREDVRAREPPLARGARARRGPRAAAVARRRAP